MWILYSVAFLLLFYIHNVIKAEIHSTKKFLTTKQETNLIRIYQYIPKYSKYKMDSELAGCNFTFHLLQYAIDNPQEECEKFSSIVLGFEELMIFIYEIRSSLKPLGEIVFPLRNNADKDAKFRVDYTEFHPDYNLDISLKKTTVSHENSVVCVKINCPKVYYAKRHCPTDVKPSMQLKKIDPHQGNWFKVGISMIGISVIVITIIMIYLNISFYAKWNRVNKNSLSEEENLKYNFKKIKGFNPYSFFRKLRNVQPSETETYLRSENVVDKQTFSENKASVEKSHSDNNNNFPNGLVAYFPTKDNNELLNNHSKAISLNTNNLSYELPTTAHSLEYPIKDNDVYKGIVRPAHSSKYIPPLTLVENEF